MDPDIGCIGCEGTKIAEVAAENIAAGFGHGHNEGVYR